MSGMTITIAIKLPLDGLHQPLTHAITLRVPDCSSDVGDAEPFQHGSEVSLDFSAIITGDKGWCAITSESSVEAVTELWGPKLTAG